MNIRDKIMSKVLGYTETGVEADIEAADAATRASGVEHVVNSDGTVVGLKLQLGKRTGSDQRQQVPHIDDIIEHGGHQQSPQADLLGELEAENAEKIAAFKEAALSQKPWFDE